MSRVIVYRSAPSLSARALVHALRAQGVDARRWRRPKRVRPDDMFVGWGDMFPFPAVTIANSDWVGGRETIPITHRTLNWLAPVGKLSEVQALVAANVDTVTVGDVPISPREGGSSTEWNGHVWLRRAFVHHSADDLLNNYSGPGFWVVKEHIRREFRVHVWAGVSSRVALKVPKGESAHPWIRSHAAGWRLDYGQGAVAVRQRHRDSAKAAAAALGLDFAAVDVAELEDGRVIVLEVNRAPGLEGRTVDKYRDKVKGWVDEQPADR